MSLSQKDAAELDQHITKMFKSQGMNTIEVIGFLESYKWKVLMAISAPRLACNSKYKEGAENDGI